MDSSRGGRTAGSYGTENFGEITIALKMYDTQAPPPEAALLIGLDRPGTDRWAANDSLDELRELAESAGVSVLDKLTQKRDAPSAPTFVGKGKVAEIAALCQKLAANTVIFDDDLSPAQGRNLGEILGPTIKVIDRTELILDIFAQRARTREGKIQVELAQLEYMLPRLTGMWTHLSRQRAGVGARGPGETQLETDRRHVQEKITRLQRQLEEVRKNRRIERSGREKLHWPRVSIIGYTNSGKSTLMNKLTDAGVLAEDKLFATLDPTTRKHRLPNNQNILLSDTVGFLRKLPHHLVESFKATLEETTEADLLLHVVDVTHPQVHEQIAAVNVVLHDLDAGMKPVVVALNKIDRIGEDRSVVERLQREHSGSVEISAKCGTNLDVLQDEIALRLSDRRVSVTLSIPADRQQAIALVYRAGYVTAREHEAGRVILRAQIPRVMAGELKPYVISEE